MAGEDANMEGTEEGAKCMCVCQEKVSELGVCGRCEDD